MGGQGSGRKKKTKSGAKGSEGASEAWDDAAAKANGGGKAQARLPLDADDVVIAREERELPTTLSATELEFLAVQHVEKQARIYELEGEIESYVKPRKKEIAGLEKEVKKLTEEQHSKVRMVTVPCRVEHDYRVNTVRIFRLDEGDPQVGVLIEQRAMTGEEREKATFEVRTDERIELPAGAEVH